MNKSLNLAYDFVKKIVLLTGLEAHPSITVIPVKSPLTKGDSGGCAFFRAIPVPRFHEDMFHEDKFTTPSPPFLRGINSSSNVGWVKLALSLSNGRSAPINNKLNHGLTRVEHG